VRAVIAGNWKMNGLGADLAVLEALKAGLKNPACDVLVCPPATLLARAAAMAGGAFAVGGQDCAPQASGAHTGDVSAAMLRDAGAAFVILGHSERRRDHGETDAQVAAKAKAASAAGLTTIICVGESRDQRQAGAAQNICQGQLLASVPKDATTQSTVIAYEPVWAIGTGDTATSADIAAMHAHLRACLPGHLREARILYGGSVTPENAAEILALKDVNGALVGGASLKAADFLRIIGAAQSS